MSHCFSLTRKGDREPSKLSAIDDAMREAFGEPPDGEHWLYGWYDSIGMGYAAGITTSRMREILEGEKIRKALDWLEANYDVASWRS